MTKHHHRMRWRTCLLGIVLLSSCYRKNPLYCESSDECTNGTRCDNHSCVPDDGGLGDSQTGDGPHGAGSNCPTELLFVRNGLFTNGQVLHVDIKDFQEFPVSNGIDVDVDAEWSPDGNHIVLTRNGSSVWVVDRDGTNGRSLDQQSGMFLLGPQWSPDGTRIVYTSIPNSGGTSAIYSVAAAGPPGASLTPALDAQDPRWSPDGSKILFTSDQPGQRDVYVMMADGSNQSNLTMRSNSDDDPAWSPDGGQIALVQSGTRIWVMDANGANLQSLTNTGFADPTWSVDGDIYFVKDPDGAAQLFVMTGAGVNQRALETDPAIDLEPVPSPDGKLLAWSSKRDGNYEIYVSNIDGSNPVRVTNNASPDAHPRWRPCP